MHAAETVFRAHSRHAHDGAPLSLFLSRTAKNRAECCSLPLILSSFSGDFFSSAAFPHRMMIRIDRPNAIVQR
ncbi:hypothetical protein HMPREF0762_01489 [Slackia exigua ATCC 700122]|uniref:Uncharacterized protein n=1 Tax=Slackia exigua (strain ATCC 700122 / DSM 15923 / CIP 105133 / JCM 11022 / KCTC 5966 / S-7) TaxID=649764 RepID=D0WI18_SLAES|nr:hypothetical protein HMPREF0762_01489 [Slackia exigua ATCC 700122]